MFLLVNLSPSSTSQGSPRLSRYAVPRWQKLKEKHDNSNKHDSTAEVGGSAGATPTSRLGLLGAAGDNDWSRSGHVRHNGAVAGAYRQQSVISGWVRRVRGWGNENCRGRGGSITLGFVDRRGERAFRRNTNDACRFRIGKCQNICGARRHSASRRRGENV
jgi:hypothetical protein